MNRALSALRAGAGDPLVREIGASRALAIRIGHGTGDELAEGRWTAARELPASGPAASTTSTRSPGWQRCSPGATRSPAETLMLRARLDAEQGRDAEARYGLRAARAALEEQPTEREAKLRKQLDALEAKLRAD